MSYTHLITGATSDVGRALIERLLQNAPAAGGLRPRADAFHPPARAACCERQIQGVRPDPL